MPVSLALAYHTAMPISEYAEELLPSRNSDLLDQVRDVVSVPLA